MDYDETEIAANYDRARALGRVDEFDQAQTGCETDDGSEVSDCLFVA
jgi:hypothetical protein